ncbi:hypothetical protein WJX81_004462 [Elliptochloris bilobata]|uniref:Uncharacterized protein n=1 Tax=Elliptochloris bilobata TaxID=381761 RepID=A0AAW1SJZ7_9CHLO
MDELLLLLDDMEQCNLEWYFRNLQSPVATQHVLVLYFSVRHHLRRSGPHFSAYEHWFAALVHTGRAEWLVPLKRNSDFDTTTDFGSLKEACAHVARLRRVAGGAPLPSGPTAASLVSPERLGRWRREAGAEAAGLAAAAHAASALASSAEAQELAALWCAADEAPGPSRSMREAAAAIESIFVAAPGRVGNIMGPAAVPDPRDSVENWEDSGGVGGEAHCEQGTRWKGAMIAEGHPCIPEGVDEGLEAAPPHEPQPMITGLLKRAVASIDLQRQKLRRSLDARIGRVAPARVLYAPTLAPASAPRALCPPRARLAKQAARA